MPDEHEFLLRYRELLAGPWLEKSKLAADYVAPVEAIGVDLSRRNIDLPTVTLVKKDAARQAGLVALFSPHWVRKPTTEAMVIRDSFDYALGQLMLTELAVETGYVPLDTIRNDVRHQLINLLWSSGARQYLVSYDYVQVRFLAARVGVDLGLPTVRPPKPDANAEVRFATFLSQHRAWATDHSIEAWLGFLDDIIEIDDEQDLYAAYLESGKAPKRIQEHFALLTAGAERFVTSLANLFLLLTDRETPYFGLVYAYWIARFYGMRLEAEGQYAVEDTDWSDELSRSIVFRSDERTTDERGAVLLNDNLEVIAKAWREIRELVEKHSAPMLETAEFAQGTRQREKDAAFS